MCHAVAGDVFQHESLLTSAEKLPASCVPHPNLAPDGAAVDFCLSQKAPRGDTLTHLIECKLADNKPHTALKRFAEQWTQSQAVQVVRNLRHEQDQGRVQIKSAATWLQGLDA